VAVTVGWLKVQDWPSTTGRDPGPAQLRVGMHPNTPSEGPYICVHTDLHLY